MIALIIGYLPAATKYPADTHSLPEASGESPENVSSVDGFTVAFADWSVPPFTDNWKLSDGW